MVRMNLWVDDMRSPPVETSRDTYYWVKTFDGAVTMLSNSEFLYDVVHLDFDLGEGPNGLDVLKWMHENDKWTLIRIHTQNPVGRQQMIDYISDVEYGRIE
jgi:hypothetical protein